MNFDITKIKPSWFLIAGGIYVTFQSLVGLRRLARSKLWLKTEGIVQSSGVGSECDMNGMLIYKPIVKYKYEVEGESYTASKLALVEVNTSFESTANAKAQKFSAGQQVTVYYDPKKPSSATLEIGDPTHGLVPVLMILSGVALLIGGVVWVVMSS